MWWCVVAGELPQGAPAHAQRCRVPGADPARCQGVLAQGAGEADQDSGPVSAGGKHGHGGAPGWESHMCVVSVGTLDEECF